MFNFVLLAETLLAFYLVYNKNGIIDIITYT